MRVNVRQPIVIAAVQDIALDSLVGDTFLDGNEILRLDGILSLLLDDRGLLSGVSYHLIHHERQVLVSQVNRLRLHLQEPFDRSAPVNALLQTPFLLRDSLASLWAEGLGSVRHLRAVDLVLNHKLILQRQHTWGQQGLLSFYLLLLKSEYFELLINQKFALVHLRPSERHRLTLKRAFRGIHLTLLASELCHHCLLLLAPDQLIEAYKVLFDLLIGV